MLEPGTRIGAHELLRRIDEGPLADAWAARSHAATDRRMVAIHVFHADVAADPTFRLTLIEEARAASIITHRNVARVLDVGEAGALLYTVTEYVDGESLERLLLRAATLPVPIPLAVALRIAADTCMALHASHALIDPTGRARPLLHREVAPRSVLVAGSGLVKLTDLGVALARERAATGARAEDARGRERYLAPEQVRRDPIGPWTDVFGVGAVLFRMLAGRAPYEAASDDETVRALLASSPPLQSLPAELPPALHPLVLRAIAPRPQDRFASARDLALALEEVLAREPHADVGGWAERHFTEAIHERRRALAPLAGAEPAGPEPAKAPTQPGFMDVRALVAGASGGAAPAASDAGVTAKPSPAPGRPAPGPTPASAPTARSPRSRRGRVLGALGAVVAVALLAAWLLLPWVIERRVVEGARAAGLELQIDDVAIGLGGVALSGVQAKLLVAPALRATVREIRVTGLFGPRDVKVVGVEATLSGERDQVKAALERADADVRRWLATGSEAAHLSIVRARVAWQGPGGDRLLAGDVGVEVTTHGPSGDEVRGAIGGLELTAAGAHLGPWSASFELTPKTSRLRVVFDPPLPDGPSALLVTQRGGPTEVTLRIPRSPFANLGVRPAELGLPAELGSDVEATVTGTLSDAGASQLAFDARVFGVRAPGLGAFDVRLQGHATGAPGRPFDLTETTLTAGPIVAALTGTVAHRGDGLVADVMFRTVPVPCERIAQMQAASAGPLAGALLALGKSTGAVRVKGSLGASGTVHYETARPNATAVSWLTRETCGVSIFGS